MTHRRSARHLAICSTASGYAVRTAPSAERALQILESATFDLIITDLKMTGMTGIDLAKQVLQKTPGLPVVILTGYGDMDSVIHAPAPGRGRLSEETLLD